MCRWCCIPASRVATGAEGDALACPTSAHTTTPCPSLHQQCCCKATSDAPTTLAAMATTPTRCSRRCSTSSQQWYCYKNMGVATRRDGGHGSLQPWWLESPSPALQQLHCCGASVAPLLFAAMTVASMARMQQWGGCVAPLIAKAME